jgi:hypothetical protein
LRCSSIAAKIELSGGNVAQASSLPGEISAIGRLALRCGLIGSTAPCQKEKILAHRTLLV